MCVVINLVATIAEMLLRDVTRMVVHFFVGEREIFNFCFFLVTAFFSAVVFSDFQLENSILIWHRLISIFV